MDNYERYAAALERGPYIRQMDLALSCRLLLSMTPWEMRTVPVTWKMLEQWDISPETLFEKASENSRKQLPPVIEPMSDVLRGFLLEEFVEKSRIDPEQALGEAKKEYQKLFGGTKEGWPEIYVLSNELRVRGAAVVFYTDVLKEFSREIDQDLVLLPSSVHEWILLPDIPKQCYQNLETMVREANTKVVLAEEVLSGHVYRFSRERNELFLEDMGKTLDKQRKNC